MLSRKSSISKTLMACSKDEEVMLALYCPFGVQGTSSSSQLDKHTDMIINAASSRLQTNQVIESKNTSFTVTHLVFKIKEVPSKTENGKKKWLDIYDVDVHSNAPASQSKAAILFSLFEPSGFFTLQLNLSWRHSRSSLPWPLFFQLRPLQAWLASGAHSKAVGSTSASEGPVSVGEDRQNSVALETAEHHQPLLNDLLAVSLVTGKRKMWRKLSVGRTWKRAKRLLAWQGSRRRRAQTRMSPTSLSEKTETWCSLIADSLAQNKPVFSIRHHNKELKGDPKTTRQTAATSEGKTELECSR